MGQRFVGCRYAEVSIAILARRRLAASAQSISRHLAKRLRPTGGHGQAFQLARDFVSRLTAILGDHAHDKHCTLVNQSKADNYLLVALL